MTRPLQPSLLMTAFLAGGLLFFTSCKKKTDEEYVSVFPDRPEVRFESVSENPGSSEFSNRQANTGNSSSDSSNTSSLDFTGSLPEFHEVPVEASAAAAIPELSNIEFALNSHDLTDEMKARLQRHIDYLSDQDYLYVVLRGHTDEQGTDEYNYSLGQRRATSVRDFLIQSGITSERLSTLSYGEDYPLDEGQGNQSLAKNRRVEFLIYQLN